MLPWWGWVLLWVAVVLAGAVLVGLRLREAWRSAKALTAEVGRASRTLAVLEAQAERLRETAEPPPAVTQDPHRLRAEHRRLRAEQVAARRARRADRLPPWARHVH